MEQMTERLLASEKQLRDEMKQRVVLTIIFFFFKIITTLQTKFTFVFTNYYSTFKTGTRSAESSDQRI